MAQDIMEQLVSLAKRRGFVYPSAELYGGTGAVWDFGPYGNRMKNNIKSLWYHRFVQERDDIVDIDSAILTRREVLAASGHEKQFNDMMVECKKCKQRFRADHEIPEAKD
ncbi:glycine--tRNA ligase, partial [Candidatus Berkelbacteria bacterium]|nr:glycine--tRNA ligase [Candidatus Berkelbacteria bacterium]